MLRVIGTFPHLQQAQIRSPHLGPHAKCREGEERLHETLQREIINVIEALNRLRESPDYQLCQLSERKPGMLDELAAERALVLEREARRLAEEIKELSGEWAERLG